MIVTAASMAGSCTSDDPPTPSRASGCTLKSDCTSPLACIFQKCHGICNETSDCEHDERCIKLPQGNICQLSSEIACTYTSQCQPPLKCAVDSKCRVACITAGDCLAKQSCVTGVCVDPDQLDPMTGMLTVSNPGGYQGEDAGVTADASADTASAPIDAGADMVFNPSADAASDGNVETDIASQGADASFDASKADVLANAPSDAHAPFDGPVCASAAGYLGGFQPTNLPANFQMAMGIKPLTLNSACAYDTDTLKDSNCGLAFAANTVSTSAMLSDGREVAVLMVESVTINVGAGFSIAGTRPLIVVANGTIDINGRVEASYSATNGAWGGGASGTPTSDRDGICPLLAGAGGGSKGNSTATGMGAGGGGFCGVGGKGSFALDAGTPTSGGASYGTDGLVPLVGGSSGGTAGGGYSATYANHGGGAIQFVSGTAIAIGTNGVIDMGGGFPGSVAKSVFGGGGGSGGAILLEAPTVRVSGVVAANGSGGGGGYLEHGDPGQASSTPATGGGVGGVGAAGAIANGGDAKPYAGSYAGGGGGAAGRIRVNVGCGGAFVLQGGLVSPDATSGCFTQGSLKQAP